MTAHDDKLWALRVLARAAMRAGRTFIVFLGCALTIVAIAGGMCACDSAQRSPSPDATTALPVCSDVGCGSGAALCTHEGVCRCPQSDGEAIECQRVPQAIDAGAGTEADAEVNGDANAATMPRIDAAP